MFDIVVACDTNRGIGFNNTLPWRLSGDMKHFRNLTSTTSDPVKQNAVIMGRKTWQSLPESNRPLPKRFNVVLSRQNLVVPAEARSAQSLDEALLQVRAQENVERCFIIGGAELYAQAIDHGDCNMLYLTELSQYFPCDTFFPAYSDLFDLITQSDTKHENGIDYCFKTYKHRRGAG